MSQNPLLSINDIVFKDDLGNVVNIDRNDIGGATAYAITAKTIGGKEFRTLCLDDNLPKSIGEFLTVLSADIKRGLQPLEPAVEMLFKMIYVFKVPRTEKIVAGTLGQLPQILSFNMVKPNRA